MSRERRGTGSMLAVNAMIRERLADLENRGWIELTALPDCSQQDVVVEGGIPAHVTTYVEVPEPGRRRIVVEICVDGERVLWIFRSRQCVVDGFEVLASGEMRPLREDEMAKFT